MTMTNPPLSPAEEARICDLLDIWGADPNRWPVDEKPAIEKALAASPQLQAQNQANAATEKMLAENAPPSELLQVRLQRAFKAYQRAQIRQTTFFTAARSGLLAASFVLGLILGGVAPQIPALEALMPTANTILSAQPAQSQTARGELMELLQPPNPILAFITEPN